MGFSSENTYMTLLIRSAMPIASSMDALGWCFRGVDTWMASVALKQTARTGGKRSNCWSNEHWISWKVKSPTFGLSFERPEKMQKGIPKCAVKFDKLKGPKIWTFLWSKTTDFMLTYFFLEILLVLVSNRRVQGFQTLLGGGFGLRGRIYNLKTDKACFALV